MLISVWNVTNIVLNLFILHNMLDNILFIVCRVILKLARPSPYKGITGDTN